ncbi:hypothetical protein NECAME_15100 [Necator americanus]|uniref:Uncharacterized protein n=1 Tax=Necator americanus TaxID=51031 RepID=W2SLP7_NECAM|nr:hypothetical protein NECAME_15100 [Necator americanus]ETN69761.1 hypothetical protein NECAME_15100 [Necator americanus]
MISTYKTFNIIAGYTEFPKPYVVEPINLHYILHKFSMMNTENGSNFCPPHSFCISITAAKKPTSTSYWNRYMTTIYPSNDDRTITVI